ncbi:MAG: LptF/LptG family permease [Puniceicoccales bacterium]|nr:LptF/LptG family permease [Puniceicoccales bacterium]
MLYRRYIFLQIFIATVCATLFFVGILLTGNVLRDILQWLIAGEMHWKLFYKTLHTLLPALVSYALPIGLLTAVFLVFGRMSEQSEILCLQTAGISLLRIAMPVFSLALVCFAGTLAINLCYGPRASYNYRRYLHGMLTKNPLQFFQSQRFIRDFPGHILYAGGRDGDKLSNLRIWEVDSGNQFTEFLHAQKGSLVHDPAKNLLRLDLVGGTLEPLGKNGTTLRFHESSVFLPQERIAMNFGEQKQLKHMDLWELLAVLRRARTESVEKNPIQRRKNLEYVAANFILHQHLAMAFSTCALAVLGIPLALRTRRAGKSIGIAISIILAFAYYFATTCIGWLQNSPYLRADYLIWLPNAILLCTGLWLFHRHLRPH